MTLAGPNARELLSRVVDADVSREALPFFRSAHLELDSCTVFVLRLSFVGELGFELHVRTDYARRVERALRAAGEDLGLVDFGYRALESMRLEKGYRMWGSDLTTTTTPFEAGPRRSRVAHEGRTFPGRDVVARQAAEGVERTLACLLVDAADADAHAWEPVYDGDRRGRPRRVRRLRPPRRAEHRVRVPAAGARDAGPRAAGGDPRRAPARGGGRGAAVRPRQRAAAVVASGDLRGGGASSTCGTPNGGKRSSERKATASTISPSSRSVMTWIALPSQRRSSATQR